MTQVISLISSSSSSSSVSYLSIFSIPPEILAEILSGVYSRAMCSLLYPEVNKTFGILMMVSKSMIRNLKLAIKYVKKSSISDYTLVKHMSGLVELRVLSERISLSMFNKNIFGNLEILSISSEDFRLLNTGNYLDILLDNTEEYPLTNILTGDDSGNILTGSCSEGLSLEYRMTKLHTICINNFTGNDPCLNSININPDIFPNIRTIKLERCHISNISEYTSLKNLRSLELNMSDIDLNKVCELNLESLKIDLYRGLDDNISITSLKNLDIISCCSDINISECVNLERLKIVRSGTVIVGRMANIQHLIMAECKLVRFSSSTRRYVLAEISDELFPSLRMLEYYKCPITVLGTGRMFESLEDSIGRMKIKWLDEV